MSNNKSILSDDAKKHLTIAGPIIRMAIEKLSKEQSMAVVTELIRQTPGFDSKDAVFTPELMFNMLYGLNQTAREQSNNPKDSPFAGFVPYPADHKTKPNEKEEINRAGEAIRAMRSFQTYPPPTFQGTTKGFLFFDEEGHSWEAIDIQQIDGVGVGIFSDGINTLKISVEDYCLATSTGLRRSPCSCGKPKYPFHKIYQQKPN